MVQTRQRSGNKEHDDRRLSDEVLFATEGLHQLQNHVAPLNPPHDVTHSKSEDTKLRVWSSVSPTARSELIFVIILAPQA